MKYEAESTVIDEKCDVLCTITSNSWGSPPIIWLTHLPRVPDVALRASLSGAELALYMGLATARDGKLQGDHCLKVLACRPERETGGFHFRPKQRQHR